MSNIIIGVGAVLLRENKILLVKRGHSPCKDYWAIPGGRIEFGESIYRAAVRELYEETGIMAKPIGIIWVDEILPHEYRDNKKHYVLIDVLVEPLDDSEPTPGSDAVDARFFELDNLPEPLTKSTRRFIDYLKNILETGDIRDKLLPVREI